MVTVYRKTLIFGLALLYCTRSLDAFSPSNFVIPTSHDDVLHTTTALRAHSPQQRNGGGQSSSELHLFSLKWASAEKDPKSFSKAVADTWRWKDAALGDGRDFFVPRPKTLAALESYFCKSASNVVLEECLVLSNCARFEILVVVSADCCPSNDGEQEINTADPGIAETDDCCQSIILKSLASSMVAQLESFQNRPFKSINIPFDWPAVIDPAAEQHPSKDAAASVTELANQRHWTHLQGERAIAQHLCLVAAGMAMRPRRPDRDVIFQPFSSRDAHILLQLKRTLENAVKKSPRISRLLKCALRAGKSVRNPSKVPEISELRKYGTGNSKYDSLPPVDVLERVTEAAKRAMEPLVEEAVTARRGSNLITGLRQSALDLAETADERQWIQKQLHMPTVQLRQGEFVDQEKFLAQLEENLVCHRGKQLFSSSTKE